MVKALKTTGRMHGRGGPDAHGVGCAGAGSLGASENEVTIAMVSNSQMTDARELSAEFEKPRTPARS